MKALQNSMRCMFTLVPPAAPRTFSLLCVLCVAAFLFLHPSVVADEHHANEEVLELHLND